jgi:hypothetical protein
MVGGARDDTETAGTRLLADLRAVFDDAGKPELPTQTILDRLHALSEAPWGDWYGKPLNPRDLAKLLKPYGAKPGVIRVGESTPRGYRAADLHDAWKRYAPGGSATSATSETPLASDVADVADVADTGAGNQDGDVAAALKVVSAILPVSATWDEQDERRD